MKKVFFYTLFLVLGFGATVQAQDMVTWEWDTYHTKFSVPSDFRVMQNTDDVFSAKNRKMSLTIYPRLDEHLSYGEMLDNLSAWAESGGVYYEEGPDYMEDLNGYWGTFIDGFSGDTPVGLLLLIDPDYPDVSMYIWLSYDDTTHDEAIEILLSFTPN